MVKVGVMATVELDISYKCWGAEGCSGETFENGVGGSNGSQCGCGHTYSGRTLGVA
jgi:hypothetical protein